MVKQKSWVPLQVLSSSCLISSLCASCATLYLSFTDNFYLQSQTPIPELVLPEAGSRPAEPPHPPTQLHSFRFGIKSHSTRPSLSSWLLITLVRHSTPMINLYNLCQKVEPSSSPFCFFLTEVIMEYIMLKSPLLTKSVTCIAVLFYCCFYILEFFKHKKHMIAIKSKQ